MSGVVGSRANSSRSVARSAAFLAAQLPGIVLTIVSTLKSLKRHVEPAGDDQFAQNMAKAVADVEHKWPAAEGVNR
jgi:hypothetical protein